MKRFWFLFLFLFALSCGAWAFLRTPPVHPTEECSRVFSSDIYSNYAQQLKAFIYHHPLYSQVKQAPSTSFNSSVQLLLTNLESSLETASERRAFHERFVSQLRHLASLMLSKKTQAQDKQAEQLVQDLVRWIYLQADLRAGMHRFLYVFVPPPTDDIFTFLRAAQKDLRLNPQFSSLQHESPVEDQFFQGNLPSLMSKPSTQLIRLGHPCDRPSRFFWWQSPSVYPEFLLFLQLQPSHLYVNLMKRKGMEGSSSHAIEDLEEQVPHAFVITLDKNSPFYWQSKPDYPEEWESHSFKEAFLKQMLAKKGSFFWSKHLERKAWREDLWQMLDAVHSLYFSNQASLNRQERQDFIELTYLAILDHLVQKWHPASMNITCKQGMDRGPSLMVLWLVQKQLLSNQEVGALLLAPPLLIHNRTSHASRIERFISAAKRVY
ncbi:hypothetical protein [Candidatus Protochlamydia phocaeensis]|uniref:hypothetical protein n=1 Tax=Candidatus Protochlamydia phocaeensis TaxID=1414722 RepID=UPI000837B58A|nr:hypothetical protein [Candidatus Protochlamydia phocaeensis]